MIWETDAADFEKNKKILAKKGFKVVMESKWTVDWQESPRSHSSKEMKPGPGC